MVPFLLFKRLQAIFSPKKNNEVVLPRWIHMAFNEVLTSSSNCIFQANKCLKLLTWRHLGTFEILCCKQTIPILLFVLSEDIASPFCYIF